VAFKCGVKFCDKLFTCQNIRIGAKSRNKSNFEYRFDNDIYFWHVLFICVTLQIEYALEIWMCTIGCSIFRLLFELCHSVKLVLLCWILSVIISYYRFEICASHIIQIWHDKECIDIFWIWESILGSTKLNIVSSSYSLGYSLGLFTRLITYWWGCQDWCFKIQTTDRCIIRVYFDKHYDKSTELQSIEM
jgi:hypothetical protein